MESCSVVGETLNCEYAVKNPQDLYVAGLREYGITVDHVYTTHTSACYFLIKHGGVIEPTLTAPQQYTQELPQGGLDLYQL